MAEVRCWQAYGDTTGFEDLPRLLSGDHAYLKIGVIVSSVSGDQAQSVLEVQWSDDGTTWGQSDALSTVTGPMVIVKKIEPQGPYWRIKGTTTGTNPVVTSTAWAIY